MALTISSTVTGSSTTRGNKPQLWDCNGTTAQRWTLPKHQAAVTTVSSTATMPTAAEPASSTAGSALYDHDPAGHLTPHQAAKGNARLASPLENPRRSP